MISEAKKQELIVEIFTLTGMKLEVDDPVTLATLYYSEKLRMTTADHQAATDAMLKKWEARISVDVERAVQTLAAAAIAERANDKRDYAAMIKQAKLAAHGEVPGIKRDVEKFAGGMMRQLREKGAPPAEIGMSLRGLLGAICVAGSAGFVAGYFWFCQPGVADGRRLPAFLIGGPAQEQVDVKGSVRHAK